MDWKQAGAVLVGGGLGSLSRWAIGQISYLQTEQSFPWPTFLVNMMGCFFIGFLSVLTISESHGRDLDFLEH